MSGLVPLLDAHDLVPALADHEAETVARELTGLSGLTVYPRSIAARGGRVYFLGRRNLEKLLCIVSRSDAAEYQGESSACEHGLLKRCPTDSGNASVLRATLHYTAPVLTGDRQTIATGDLLGLATPGHIRAVRGGDLTPILAQQSMNGPSSALRSPEDVIDSVTWGVFEEGFRNGFGAEADSVRSSEDAARALSAGFRLLTIDVSNDIDESACSDDPATLKRKLNDLPWHDLETTQDDCRKMFAGKTFEVGLHLQLKFTREAALRTVAKHGAAVAHFARLHRHLVDTYDGPGFEPGISLDATASATGTHEHLYVAHELKRLGVRVASVALRLVGDFKKAVDYKDDLDAFEKSFQEHVQIARHFGPYKISINSESDRFSIYPVLARHGGELVHVRIGETSYLEALRVVSKVDPGLFREILSLAFERHNEDKRSRNVSAHGVALPCSEKLAEMKFTPLLDMEDVRQALHATLRSVMTARSPGGDYQFRERLLHALRANEEMHYDIVARNTRKHMEALAPRQ